MAILIINGISVDLENQELQVDFTIDNEGVDFLDNGDIPENITQFYLATADGNETAQAIMDNNFLNLDGLVRSVDYTVSLQDASGIVMMGGDVGATFAVYSYTLPLAGTVPYMDGDAEVALRAALVPTAGLDQGPDDGSALAAVDNGIVTPSFDSNGETVEVVAPALTNFVSVLARKMVGQDAPNPRMPTDCKPHLGDILALGSLNIIGADQTTMGKRIPFFSFTDETVSEADDAILSANPKSLTLGDGRFTYDRNAASTSITDTNVTITADQLNLESSNASAAQLSLSADAIIQSAANSIALDTSAASSAITLNVSGAGSQILLANSQAIFTQDVALTNLMGLITLDGAGLAGEIGDGETPGDVQLLVNVQEAFPATSPDGYSQQSAPAVAYSGSAAFIDNGDGTIIFSTMVEDGAAFQADLRGLREAASWQRELIITMVYTDGHSETQMADVVTLFDDQFSRGVAGVAIIAENEAIRKSVAIAAPTTSVDGDFYVKHADALAQEEMLAIISLRDGDDTILSSMSMAAGFVHISNNARLNEFMVADGKLRVDTAENTADNGYVKISGELADSFPASIQYDLGAPIGVQTMVLESFTVDNDPSVGWVTTQGDDWIYEADKDLRRLMEEDSSYREIPLTATYVYSGDGSTTTQSATFDPGLLAQVDPSMILEETYATIDRVDLEASEIKLNASYLDLKGDTRLSGDLKVEAEKIDLQSSIGVNVESSVGAQVKGDLVRVAADSAMELKAPGFHVRTGETQKIRLGEFDSLDETAWPMTAAADMLVVGWIEARETISSSGGFRADNFQVSKSVDAIWDGSEFLFKLDKRLDNEGHNHHLYLKGDLDMYSHGNSDGHLNIHDGGLFVGASGAQVHAEFGSVYADGLLQAGHSLKIRPNEGGTGIHGFYVPVLEANNGVQATMPLEYDEGGNVIGGGELLYSDAEGIATTEADNGLSGEEFVAFDPIMEGARPADDAVHNMLSTRGLDLAGSLGVGGLATFGTPANAGDAQWHSIVTQKSIKADGDIVTLESLKADKRIMLPSQGSASFQVLAAGATGNDNAYTLLQLTGRTELTGDLTVEGVTDLTGNLTINEGRVRIEDNLAEGSETYALEVPMLALVSVDAIPASTVVEGSLAEANGGYLNPVSSPAVGTLTTNEGPSTWKYEAPFEDLTAIPVEDRTFTIEYMVAAQPAQGDYELGYSIGQAFQLSGEADFSTWLFGSEFSEYDMWQGNPQFDQGVSHGQAADPGEPVNSMFYSENEDTSIDPANPPAGSSSVSIAGQDAGSEQSDAADDQNRISSSRGLNLSGGLAVAGNMTLTGDLVVNGTQTAVNTEVTTLEDNVIHLARKADGSQADIDPFFAGLRVERGLHDAAMLWVMDPLDSSEGDALENGDPAIRGGHWRFGQITTPETTAGALLDLEARTFRGGISSISEYLPVGSNTPVRHSTAGLDEDPNASVTSGTMYFTAARVHTATVADGNAIDELIANNVKTLSLTIDSYAAAVSAGSGSGDPQEQADYDSGHAAGVQWLSLGSPGSGVLWLSENGYDIMTSNTAFMDGFADGAGGVAANESYNGYVPPTSASEESGTQIPLTAGVDGLYASYSLSVSSADAPEGYTVDAADFGSLAYAPSTGALTAVLPTNHDVWGTFSAADAVATEGDTAHGGLAFSEGVITLTRVTNRMIRGDVSGGNAIQYAGADDQDAVVQSEGVPGKLALSAGQFGLYIDADSTFPLTDGTYGLKALASGSNSIQYGSVDGQSAVTYQAAVYDEETGEEVSAEVLQKLALGVGQFALQVDPTNTFQMTDGVGGLKALMDAGDAAESEKTYGSLAFAVSENVNTHTLTRVKATEIHVDILVEDLHKDGGEVDENGDLTGVAQVFAGTAEDNTIRVAVLEKVLDATVGSETMTNRLKSFNVGDVRAMQSLTAADVPPLVAESGVEGQEGYVEEVADVSFGGLSYDATTGAWVFTGVTGANIKGLFGAEVNDAQSDGAGSTSGLSYDPITGRFTYEGSFEDDIKVGSLTQSKLIDNCLNLVADGNIDALALVDHSGKMAKARVNDWQLAGQAMEGALDEASLLGKIHMMPKRSCISVLAESGMTLVDGDHVFLSAMEAGRVTNVLPDNDTLGITDGVAVLVGRMISQQKRDASGAPLFLDGQTETTTDTGTKAMELKCIVADQFLFDA